ncbi:hypothetical protein ACFOW6_04740 [Fodinicurvata halophila]|uniref:Guanylate cyclase domain-containing protein n=1 Tax=Fodinicurvata halophila TaxID=1419723 RepID=A0ABV8UK46_9PROT
MKYTDKFVAFIDILGFKQIVEKSVIIEDAESIARMIKRLAPESDIAFYQNDGAEICPCSESYSSDLAMRISQISDCVVISAEISAAGVINIIHYCQKVAERLLLRESVLCQGYLTRGKIVHDGMMFFGPGYQAAVEGEKQAASIEWRGEVLGTPFIEIDPDVVAYLKSHGDDCTHEMFTRMTVRGTTESYISPYGIFDRLANWASDPSKSPDQIFKEFNIANSIIERIEKDIAASKPKNLRAREKLRITQEELSKARERLAEAQSMILS